MADPSQAAFTYIRGECQRCHLGVRRQAALRRLPRAWAAARATCPTGTWACTRAATRRSQGADAGRPLVHSIQAGVGAPVTAGDVDVDAASRSRRARPATTAAAGSASRSRASWRRPTRRPGRPRASRSRSCTARHYLKLHEDLHKSKGFLCQDCHTTLDVHSSGKLCGAITGAVEIECCDCHGTPRSYPWELPLGTMDEYAREAEDGRAPRHGPDAARLHGEGRLPAGRRRLPADRTRQPVRQRRPARATRSRCTSRPAPSRSCSPLKLHDGENTALARGARGDGPGRRAHGAHGVLRVPRHLGAAVLRLPHQGRLLATAGCDYDWVEIGHATRADGLTRRVHRASPRRLEAPRRDPGDAVLPPLGGPAPGRNGEGRDRPVVPGCQTSVTVIDKDGKTVVANHIALIPNVEGRRPRGTARHRHVAAPPPHRPEAGPDLRELPRGPEGARLRHRRAGT